MPDPVLHLIAGPNGSGKSTLFEHVIGPATRLPCINADHIAAERWPDEAERRSYDAAIVAAEQRAELLHARVSFATETVFSHPSKLHLLNQAVDAGYLVTLHVVLVPEALAVARVASRVEAGGHSVPRTKVRERYRRLWPLVAQAIAVADTALLYDNSRIQPALRRIATVERGVPLGDPDWPRWTPRVLRTALR